MKWVRRLVKIALGVVIVLAVVAIVALFFLGPVVKTAVNTVGPKMLGVPVEVQAASIRPLGGVVRLAGVRIGNPEGYSDDPLFSLGEVRIDLDMASLPGKRPIVINELALIEPQVAYEVAGGKSNIEALTANLPKSDKEKEPKEKKEKKEGRKVIIDLLEFRDGQLSYRSKVTLGQAVAMPLPNLKMTEIGRYQGGIEAVEAIGKVLGELLNLVGTVVAQIGTAAIDTGKAAIGAGADVVGAGADAVGAGADAVGAGADAVKSVGSAAKGLLKSVTGGADDAPEK